MTTTTTPSVTVDRHFATWNDKDPASYDGRLLDVRGFFASPGA